MKVRSGALLIAALLLASCANGPTPADPTEDIAATVDAWRRRTPVPGVVVLVADPKYGERTFASGTLHRNGRVPMGPDTQFRAASITKVLVATVVMQLVDEGRLSLDRPVLEYLAPGHPLGGMLDGVTIRHLLAHTSGIPDASRSPKLTEAMTDDPGRRWSVEEVLEQVRGRDPEFRPGRSYGYSNTNYLLLGHLIEAVAGRPWHAEVRQRILDPLGMDASYMAGVEQPRGRLAPGYFDLDNDGATELVPDPWPSLETTEGAAGALVSTAGDLATFVQALATGRLLPERWLEEMTRPGAYSSRYTGYGLGLEIRRPDLMTSVWGHGGFLPGFRSILWYAPSRDVSIVVLTNESRSRPDGLAELIMKTIAR